MCQKCRRTNIWLTFWLLIGWLINMYYAGWRSSWRVWSSEDSCPVAGSQLLCLTELNWPASDSVLSVVLWLKPSMYQPASATTTTDVYTASLRQLNGFHLRVQNWWMSVNYVVSNLSIFLQHTNHTLWGKGRHSRHYIPVTNVTGGYCYISPVCYTALAYNKLLVKVISHNIA